MSSPGKETDKPHKPVESDLFMEAGIDRSRTSGAVGELVAGLGRDRWAIARNRRGLATSPINTDTVVEAWLWAR
jgi:hypothetical protein